MVIIVQFWISARGSIHCIGCCLILISIYTTQLTWCQEATQVRDCVREVRWTSVPRGQLPRFTVSCGSEENRWWHEFT